MEHKIVLVQEPKISHEIKAIGAEVTKRLAELDLENQVVTADTVKTLKKLRADLNKELEEFESQRKLIKSKVLEEYNAMEDEYKPEISEKYKAGISTLKVKIDDYENSLKDKREEELKAYFIELCQTENIDFVIFDQLGLDITLSSSTKSYKEKINKFIQKICNDIDLINTMGDDTTAMMVEFKKTLDVSKAIQDVKARREQEKAEANRVLEVRTTNRINKLVNNLAVSFEKTTKSYYYNDNIHISLEEIEELEDSDFENSFAELKGLIEADIAENTHEAPVEKTTEPLQAPTVEEKEKIVKAKFEATGTFAQLKALGQYMKNHNIQYKNL